MTLLGQMLREDGKIEGKIEDILDLLGDLGEIPIALKVRIKKETNIEELSKLHRYAAKCKSIDEFMQKAF